METSCEHPMAEFVRFEFSEKQVDALKAEMHNWWDFEGYADRNHDGTVKFHDETKKALHHLFAHGACVVIDQMAVDMRAAVHLRENGPALLVTLFGDDLYDGTVALDFRKMIERSLSEDTLEIHDDPEEVFLVDHLREIAKMFSDAADRLSERFAN